MEPEHIKVLVIEDSDDDFFFVQRELLRDNRSVEITRVDNAVALQKALLESEWDIVLSDYTLPTFNAIEALRIVRSSRPDLPFVAVSGSIGEEAAVALLRAGAADYVMKDRLVRLPSIVQRELRLAAQARERRQLERELRHLQKIEALGMLAGGIAHDFNNVLMAINGYSELALAKLDPTHPAHEDLQMVMQSAARSTRLVRRLLSFARRNDDSPPEQVDLQLVIAGAQSILRSTLPKNVDLQVSGEPGAYVVAGNTSELEQLVINLCTNAGHAIGQQNQGHIMVSLDFALLGEIPARLVSGRYCRLKVADDGPGMSAEVLEHIFEPFFTTKPAGEGTGLGLSMAQRVVAGMGGAIHCDSTVGKGTCFSVLLPAQGAAVAAAPGRTTEPAPRLGQGQHIMVVDDEELLVNMTALMLQQAGFRVTKFFDPHSALTAFNTNPLDYDLLVTDLAMPGMTGYDLAKELHKSRPEMPVILCTGYMGPPDSDMHNQCKMMLAKPYTRESLINAVNQTLTKPTLGAAA